MDACVIDWSAVAAWVQAIGSIVAIWGAFAIGERANKRAEAMAEQTRKRQAAIVATAAISTIKRIEMRAEVGARSIRKRAGEITNTGNIVFSDAVGMTQAVEITEDLSALLPSALVFDETAGRSLILVESVVAMTNETLRRKGKQMNGKALLRTAVISELESMAEALDRVHDACGEALNALSIYVSPAGMTDT